MNIVRSGNGWKLDRRESEKKTVRGGTNDENASSARSASRLCRAIVEKDPEEDGRRRLSAGMNGSKPIARKAPWARDSK